METPQPNPEDQRIQDPELAHDIGLQADAIIQATHAGNPDVAVSSEHRHDVVTLASELAQSQSEKQAQDDELRLARRAAETDGLTGLANQDAFNKALATAEADPKVVVASFDGDNFGNINKVHNQDAGDAVIIAMADAIRDAAHAQGSNRIFRVGGDEFCVLCDPEIAEAIIADAQRRFAAKIFGKDALADGRGNPHPSEWYREMGISGAFAGTRVEADVLMQKQKQLRKSLQRSVD